jgi:hypothetical protein
MCAHPLLLDPAGPVYIAALMAADRTPTTLHLIGYASSKVFGHHSAPCRDADDSAGCGAMLCCLLPATGTPDCVLIYQYRAVTIHLLGILLYVSLQRPLAAAVLVAGGADAMALSSSALTAVSRQ